MAEIRHPGDTDRLRESAAKVIRSGVLGTGRVLPKLFEYLLRRALDGEVPKEFDIAVDVFGKDPRHLDGGDAQIRVWIYRLRSRLEHYYADAGRSDPRPIQIPKGTYKLEAVSRVSDEGASPPRAARGLTLAAGIAAVACTVAVAIWFFSRYSDSSAETALVSNSVWSGMAASDLPIIVVVGDHFFFGEPGAPVRIRDIRINSEDELRQSSEFHSNPDLIFDTLSYLPKSALFSLPSILQRVSASSPHYALKLASELTPEDMRVADIVFIGFIRSMGVLREYYLKDSNFLSQTPYLEIVNADTHDVYSRTGPLAHSNTDYGLFARLPGPTGNQILVFSGIGDPGVLATARALNSPEGIGQIDELIERDAVDASGAWEVLLEVDGHSRTDLDYRIVGLFPIDRPHKHESAQPDLHVNR